MKLGSTRKFQVGGAMPQGGEDPMAMLLQAAQQATQASDCEVALQVCQMLLELSGGAAAQPAPAEAAPAPAEGQPVYAKGGRLIRRIKA